MTRVKYPIQQVIDGIEQVARPTIRRDFRPDCCIATTRTVVRVLRHFGYDAQPIPVRTMIYNPKMVEAIKLGSVKRGDDPDFFNWCERTGAWSVGLGYADGSNGFEGHLVAALPRQKIFVDASLDQASRPARDLELPPVLVSELTEEFITTPGAYIEFAGTNGSAMIYQRIARDDWRRSRDWSDASRTKRAMKTIIAHIVRSIRCANKSGWSRIREAVRASSLSSALRRTPACNVTNCGKCTLILLRENSL